MAAGLSREGFTPLTYDELVARMGSRQQAYNPGFDLSEESPDGQLLRIFGFELALAWQEMSKVHYSYNPMVSDGDGLKNLGLITGIPFGVATRSQANVNLVGVTGTVVNKGSIVNDVAGNDFVTQFTATIPASVLAIANLSGPVPMPVGTITSIKSTTPGWTSVTQTIEGQAGAQAQTEEAFRNVRNKTVLRNFKSVPSIMEARLAEIGILQSVVFNNSSNSVAADGTPVGGIHVTVGETTGVTNDQIAKTILLTAGNGTPTIGATAVNVTDSQGTVHTVRFDQATAIDLVVNIDLTYLSIDNAGAVESIQEGILAEINGLLAGEDVIWSRLFGLITPYGKAQVNTLTIGLVAGTPAATNYAIADGEFALITVDNINITES